MNKLYEGRYRDWGLNHRAIPLQDHDMHRLDTRPPDLKSTLFRPALPTAVTNSMLELNILRLLLHAFG